jgi:hypothetical protein
MSRANCECGCKQVTPEQRELIVQRHLAGEISTLIAVELGLAKRCVQAWVGKHKYEPRKLPSERGKRRHEFLRAIAHRKPDRDHAEKAFGRLDEADRVNFTPAFDLYLQAMQHLDEMRRLQTLAVDVFAAELTGTEKRVAEPKTEAA